MSTKRSQLKTRENSILQHDFLPKLQLFFYHHKKVPFFHEFFLTNQKSQKILNFHSKIKKKFKTYNFSLKIHFFTLVRLEVTLGTEVR